MNNQIKFILGLSFLSLQNVYSEPMGMSLSPYAMEMEFRAIKVPEVELKFTPKGDSIFETSYKELALKETAFFLTHLEVISDRKAYTDHAVKFLEIRMDLEQQGFKLEDSSDLEIGIVKHETNGGGFSNATYKVLKTFSKGDECKKVEFTVYVHTDMGFYGEDSERKNVMIKAVELLP
jgi:hypothetical protein